jgi:hypothetical protein
MTTDWYTGACLPTGHRNALIASSFAGTVCCAKQSSLDRAMMFKSNLFMARSSGAGGGLMRLHEVGWLL